MNEFQSQIYFSGMNPSRTIARASDRMIRKWLDQIAPKPIRGQTGYLLRIHRERRNAFFCEVEIHFGSHRWCGSSTACTVQETVLNALDDISITGALERLHSQNQQNPIPAA